MKNDIDGGLVDLLGEYGVGVEAIDDCTTRLLAVPVSEQFSKPRTNLLLRYSRLTEGCTAYVDGDLVYHGADPVLQSALQGPSVRNWRELRVPPAPGGVAEALCTVLHLLGSPLAGRVQAVLGVKRPAEEQHSGPELSKGLAAIAERITLDTAAAAYQSSFRQELADQLAIITQRPTAPNSALLWGRPGSGRDHLMLASAFPLLEKQRVRQVLRIPAACIVAGAIFPGEIDGALMRFLNEATAQERTLFLIQDLETCLTGSSVSFSLLSNALDRGLRMLATIRYEQSMARLQETDPGLARRFVGIHVEEPSRAELSEALNQLATTSAVPVATTAIQTALKLAGAQPSGDPAAALGLLGGAMAEAAWQGNPEVGPDDVSAVLRNDWPNAAGQE